MPPESTTSRPRLRFVPTASRAAPSAPGSEPHATPSRPSVSSAWRSDPSSRPTGQTRFEAGRTGRPPHVAIRVRVPLDASAPHRRSPPVTEQHTTSTAPLTVFHHPDGPAALYRDG